MSTIGQLRIWLGTKVNAVRKDCCYLFYSIFIHIFISTNTYLHFGATDDIETVGGYNEAELEDMMNEDNNDGNWLCFFCFVKTDKSNSHLLNILSKTSCILHVCLSCIVRVRSFWKKSGQIQESQDLFRSKKSGFNLF